MGPRASSGGGVCAMVIADGPQETSVLPWRAHLAQRRRRPPRRRAYLAPRAARFQETRLPPQRMGGHNTGSGIVPLASGPWRGAPPSSSCWPCPWESASPGWRRRRGAGQGACMHLHFRHGASRRAAAPHLPLEMMKVSPLLYLVAAVGVGEPTRRRLQEAIITSIVPSPLLELVLLLMEGLRLWGRRRSASAQGFFTAVSSEGPACIGPAATYRRTAPSASPSARLPGYPHRLGQWDLLHEPTLATRTTLRTSAPLLGKVLDMVPCGIEAPWGAGRGLHLGFADVHPGHAPSPLRGGAAGTASSPRSWCCTG